MRVPASLAIVAILAATAPPAAATWREQRLASPDATSFSDPPSIAANARGDTAVAWTARPRAFLAVRRAGAARFGRPIELRRFARPRVVVLSDGTVLLASELADHTDVGPRPCCRVVFVQRMRPGSRRLTPWRALTTRGISVGMWTLAAGPRGRAALAADVDGLALATSRATGRFGALVSPPYDALFGQPFVGFGGDGRGLALWADGPFGSEQRLMGAPIDRAGHVAPARVFATAPNPLSDAAFREIRAGFDDRGRLTVLWLDEGWIVGKPSTIDVATGSIGTIGRRTVLGDNGILPGGVRDPVLAVARNGRAVAAWRSFGPGGERSAIAIRSGPSAAFRVLPAMPGDGYGPRIALSPSGHAIVVSGFNANARARVMSPAGAFGAPRALAGSPSSAGVGLATVGRRIVLAWGTRHGLRAATFTPPR
jgi:hypothetical protein